MLAELIRGVSLPGPITNLGAAAVLVANAQAIYTASNLGAAVGTGTKSLKLRKLFVRNNAAGNQWLHVGTGAGATFVDAIPAVMVINNLDNNWEEVELPSRELFATITAYLEALVAGGSMDVQLEVEEVG